MYCTSQVEREGIIQLAVGRVWSTAGDEIDCSRWQPPAWCRDRCKETILSFEGMTSLLCTLVSVYSEPSEYPLGTLKWEVIRFSFFLECILPSLRSLQSHSLWLASKLVAEPATERFHPPLSQMIGFLDSAHRSHFRHYASNPTQISIAFN